MEVNELFERCIELLQAEPRPGVNAELHELLVVCCAEGTRGTGQGYGSLMAQVEYLCRKHGVAAGDRVAIQTLRRHSNQREELTAEELRYDVRALALFVSALFHVDIPDGLVRLIPTENRPKVKDQRASASYIRCVVSRWNKEYVYAESDYGPLRIVWQQEELYVRNLLRQGMQLNLLDCRVQEDVVSPGLTVVEPDFLIDISAVAVCFTDEGHHPLNYLKNRLKPRANSQAILLGNFAGRALDDIINQKDFQVDRTLVRTFREQLLQFCTCEDFDGQKFANDARLQTRNLQETVDVLFSSYDRSHAVLEPSFVCERLGLLGRVDLMTTDKQLLVEQKSGRNMRIEKQAALRHREDHYVQLLLYFGILRYQFGLSADRVDIRLLYSKYPPKEGLLVVNYYRQLFREAIKQRNLIVAWEYFIASNGFDKVMGQVLPPEWQLSALERTYLSTMMTFVYREQLRQKTGGQEGMGGAVSDLWNMPLAGKQAMGSIYDGLTLTDRRRSGAYGGYDLLTLEVPQDCPQSKNFRRGDSVYLYAYQGEPDVRQQLLYQGTLEEVSSLQLTVRLNDGQQNPEVLQGETWAVEHAGGDTCSSSMRGLCLLMTADKRKRDLLLGQRTPEADTTISLSRRYHPDYDDVLLRARQAKDYFLLVGPPGTGKTSMALRFMVEEELTAGSDILLTAYTNRAVDEICAMLTEARIAFLRLGNESSCDPRFRKNLLGEAMGEGTTMTQARERIARTRVIVGTTSMLQARPFLFALKHFTVAMVDEASQILEPSIMGLLAQAIDRFILIGDHKQLPAVVQQPAGETTVREPLLNDIGITDCRHSLFERLLRWEERQGRTQFMGLLRRQGRMHPDIAAFPNRLFYAREKLEPVPLEHQLDTSLHYDLPSQDALDDLLKQERMIFLPAGSEDEEARLTADLLRRIHRFYGDRFDAAKTVGVIVPYRSQIDLIRRQLEQLGIPQLTDISIDTVERYQGSQRDVIVYSFAISHTYQLDFLTSNCFEEDGRTIDRKLNVAITRARKQMLMTGNEEILRKNKIFSELITLYRKKVCNFAPNS